MLDIDLLLIDAYTEGRTLPSELVLKRAIEYEKPLRWVLDPEIPQLCLDGGFGVGQARNEAEADALKRPYEELLSRARATPEAARLVESRRELDAERDALARELQRIGALHVIRGSCDLCR